MSWTTHWQCSFQSFGGSQYSVNICEQNYSGDVVELTGAEQPFETQEDDDDDIFTPVRKQTGYLRVIDTDGTLMEELMPANNTERLVRLVESVTSGGTTTEVTRWQGFLCAQAFTQTWDQNVRVLEMPIKSILAALEDVSIDTSLAGTDTYVAGLLTNGVAALMTDGTEPFDTVVIIDDCLPQDGILTHSLQYGIFFNEEEIANQGDFVVEFTGQNYLEILKSVCAAYGLTARENGTSLYLAHYDLAGEHRLYTCTITWESFVSYATIGRGTIACNSDVSSEALLTAATFRGTDNTKSFVQGGRNARVVFSLGDYNLSLKLPRCSEDDSTPIEFAMHTGTLYVQVHEPRVSDFETYAFNVYNQHTWSGTSTFEDMEASTVIEGYNSNPYAVNADLYTGAFPVRWYHKTGTERVTLQNGLYINTQYKTASQSTSPSSNSCWSVSSRFGYTITEGWLNLQLTLWDLIWYTGISSPYWLLEDASSMLGSDVITEVHCCLSIGDKFWNGSAWVDGSAPNTKFVMFLKNGKVQSNKTSDMNTSVTDGYFFPVTSEMQGNISFHILNVAIPKYNNSAYYAECYTHILSDFELKVVYPDSITASDRSENVYLDTIGTGFSAEKKINTTIGTNNNNLFSPALLRGASSRELIETMPYQMMPSGAIEQRPEMHTLERMVSHYGSVRRTLTGRLATGLSLCDAIYSYENRLYFGIDASHLWRDDVQDVKFLEIEQS